LWCHRNLVLGIPAIFLDLIAEIGVSNLFINFMSAPEIGNLTHAQASNYLLLLWGGMMVGRFVGSHFMRRVSAATVRAIASAAAFLVMRAYVLFYALWGCKARSVAGQSTARYFPPRHFSGGRERRGNSNSPCTCRPGRRREAHRDRRRRKCCHGQEANPKRLASTSEIAQSPTPVGAQSC
jgi:hypothetical protein